LIEGAYTCGEQLGLPVFCQDEAGPYQAIPQPGSSWQLIGKPARQPHEWVRGGTVKLLTLFRPATGEVWAKPVEHAPNTVLHPVAPRGTDHDPGRSACTHPATRSGDDPRGLGGLAGRPDAALHAAGRSAAPARPCSCGTISPATRHRSLSAGCALMG
jgi:hypothetical protein